MKLHQEVFRRKSFDDLMVFVKMPQIVHLRPHIAGTVCDLEVEALVADALVDIAWREGKSIDELCTEILVRYAPGLPLSSGVRTFTLNYFRNIAVV